jgi:hypothetical protein
MLIIFGEQHNLWNFSVNKFPPPPVSFGSRDSVVGTATGYVLDGRGVGVQVPVGSRIFSSPRRPDRIWGLPSLLSIGYRGLFPRWQRGRFVKLTIHFQTEPRARKCGSIHPFPHTPSWLSALLIKHRDNFTFTLPVTFSTLTPNIRSNIPSDTFFSFS